MPLVTFASAERSVIFTYVQMYVEKLFSMFLYWLYYMHYYEWLLRYIKVFLLCVLQSVFFHGFL